MVKMSMHVDLIFLCLICAKRANIVAEAAGIRNQYTFEVGTISLATAMHSTTACAL